MTASRITQVRVVMNSPAEAAYLANQMSAYNWGSAGAPEGGVLANGAVVEFHWPVPVAATVVQAAVTASKASVGLGGRNPAMLHHYAGATGGVTETIVNL
jgi:hypothetical protein